MRTVYATTRAGAHDTRAIAKGKWLQQLQNPSTAAAGLLAEPISTEPHYHDCKVRTIQRILTALQ